MCDSQGAVGYSEIHFKMPGIASYDARSAALKKTAIRIPAKKSWRLGEVVDSSTKKKWDMPLM